MNQYKLIAMIPARLGSKRIPKKNLRYLGEKPLIQYPIDLALQMKEFDSVWVNTESEELGQASVLLGAQFHKRPKELSTDKATNRDFTYEFMQKHDCDYVIMINTTSPLLRNETVKKFVNFINNNNFDTVVSVVSEKEETFYKGMPLNFSFDEKVNSQMLEPTQKIVWALTAWKRGNFMSMQEKKNNPVFGGKVGIFEIPKDEACDLDTEEDWRIAEGILQSRSMEIEKKYLALG